MAESTARTFSYISMVLTVSGRVRPVDLQMITETERSATLHAFFDASASSTPMHFDGDNLLAGAGPQVEADPAPVSASEPGIAAPAAAPGEAPAAAPGEAPAGGPVESGSAPAEFFGFGAEDAGPAVTTVATPGTEDLPVATPMSDYVTLNPEYAMPMSVTAPASADVAPAPAAVPDLTEPSGPAPSAATPDADTRPEPELARADPSGSDVPEPKASGLFWLLPVFFSWIGGLVAFLVVRKTNAKQARGMLLLGIGLTVAYILLVLAFLAVGGALLFTAGSSAVTTSGPSVVTTSAPAPVSAPAATSTVPAKKP